MGGKDNCQEYVISKNAFQLEKAKILSVFSRPCANEVAPHSYSWYGSRITPLIELADGRLTLSSQCQQVGNATIFHDKKKGDVFLTSHKIKTIMCQEHHDPFLFLEKGQDNSPTAFLQALKIMRIMKSQVIQIYIIDNSNLLDNIFYQFFFL